MLQNKVRQITNMYSIV